MFFDVTFQEIQEFDLSFFCDFVYVLSPAEDIRYCDH